MGQVVAWWYGFGSVGCVDHGLSGGFGVVGQVGLWCGDWWVSLGYLMVVLLGLGVMCVASLVAPLMAPVVIFLFLFLFNVVLVLV